MAAIYRFGFEGGYFPRGVSVSGGYTVSEGRFGIGSSGITSVDSTETFVILDSKEPSDIIYITEYFNISAYGSGADTNILKFGPISISYSILNGNLSYKNNGNVIWQNVVSIPSNTYVPLSLSVFLNNSGSIETKVGNSTYTFSGDVLSGSLDTHPNKIYLGIGLVGGPQSQFTIDDIAINNGVSVSNLTGSYGTDDNTYPQFIQAFQSSIISTGSTFQWSSGNPQSYPSIPDIVNGTVDSYLIASKYNKVAQFVPAPITSASAAFEGMNVYVIGASTLNVNQKTFLNTYFQTNGNSVNEHDNAEITSVPSTVAYSVFEKDRGGKLTVQDFNSGSIVVVPRQAINKNYYGYGGLGNVEITSSTVIPTDGDFTFLEYQNLAVLSGSTITTSDRCRGLVIYVKENCIIEGSISMDGKGMFGSSGDASVDVWKNTSSLFLESNANLISTSTWPLEQENQLYSSGTSSWFGLNQFTPPNNTGLVGGGGNGGSTSQASGGFGGTSSLWAGGLGGSGAASSLFGIDANNYSISGGGGSIISGSLVSGQGAQHGGGVIYIIVGKNLILGSQSFISARGLTGSNATGTGGQAGGGGGSGGGNITLFYGFNLYNLSGSINVSGGAGGLGINSGQNGSSGSAGTIRLVSLY